MANSNVRFFFTDDRMKYENLVQKDPLALYFIEDIKNGYRALYKGDNLIAVGSNASSMAAGLMTSDDKRKLDSLSPSQGISELVPVDGTIVVTEGNKIGVSVVASEDNALVKQDGGLFVPKVSVPEFTIEKQESAEDGFIATYKLKRTVNGETSDVGDSINIPKDKVLQSAVMRTVETADEPYDGAKVGDKYIDMAFNDENQSHIYIPMGDIGKDVSTEIKIDTQNANGLSCVDGSTLSLCLASAESNGAMSKEMFTAVDGLLKLDVATKEDVKSAIAESVGAPNAEQFIIDENGVLSIDSIDADKVIYKGKKLSEVLEDMNSSYTWAELPEIVNTDASSAVANLSAVSDGAIVKIDAGTVSEAVSVDKSVTVEGANAGVAQNFSQEV